MIVRQYAPCSLGRSIICLGKQGEINALRVEFDVSAWMAMYPDATVKLMHFAPDRTQDNPVIPTLGVEGTLRVWIVGEEDTAGAGNGVIELLLIDERTGSTIKSATGYTTVLRSPSAGIEEQEAEAGYVRYDVDQSALLTDEQKAVARKNIGAGTGDDTGSGSILKETDPTVPAWAKQPSKPTYTAGEVGARPDSWTPSASDVGADAAGTASGAVAAHNTSGAAHADLRALIEGLTSRLNALADSDDTTLDQLGEIVAYIKSNRTLIDAVTTGKVSVSDIVDNLTTNASGKVLSAAQGVALKGLIDAIVIPDKLPNPQPLTINGQSYDGSAAVEVSVTGEGSGFEVDATLTQSGKAADAKAVGDRLTALNEAKVNKTGWTAGKYLGTDDGGNVVEKDAPTGVESGAYVSPLSGKRLSILGDSISTYAGYIPDGYATYYSTSNLASVDDTWWKKLIDATGMELCVNNSYSGTRVAVTSWLADYAGCLSSRNMALHDGDRIPDIIFVAMGCNDFNNEIDLGNYDASDGLTFDTSKFSDAYAQTLYNITITYPTSRVYCCTCAASERNTPTDGPELNSQGKAFYEFNDLIRRLARTYNCGVIDFESCGITHENLSYYMVDGVQHPNAYGHSLMANKVIETIDPSNSTRYAGLAPVVVIEETVAVTGVSLDQTALSLEQWETVQLTATITPADATTKTVQWKSSDNSVATVEGGLVTAVGDGDATITVTTDDGGYTATCTVSVTAASLSDVQVTSITNTPGQYIDTGYVTTKNTKFEMDWVMKTFSSQSPIAGTNGLCVGTLNVQSGVFRNVGGHSQSTTTNYNFLERSTLALDYSGLYRNGENIWPISGQGLPSSVSDIRIFGATLYPRGGADAISTASYTLYGFKIYESDELVKDFVPWVDADGRACLKEIIGGTYHYDATGGTFDYAV